MTRRFYQNATLSEDGLGVLLDARTLRTPGGIVFRAPTQALVQAVASEWAAQGENIAPATMPLTQLVFAALDVTPGRRDELSANLVKFLETDLVCHRADHPAELVARQVAIWDPIVDWANGRFHMRIPVVTGVLPGPVTAEMKIVLAWEIDDLDDFRLTALAQAINLAGSALIGFALLEKRLDAEAAFAAAALDDLWSLERWGEDAEARGKLDRLKRDLSAVGNFIDALSG
jgi:chaperone required for assembly of F1-ATPase